MQPNPYRKPFKGMLDIYSICELYGVRSHAIGHAVKKLLAAGKRGAKSYEQDLKEAILSIQRELEMQANTREPE